jgi:predicted transcriptional regulator
MEKLAARTTSRQTVAVLRYARLRCQKKVARSLGISQPAVSKLLRRASVELTAAKVRELIDRGESVVDVQPIDVVRLVRGGCSVSRN